MGRHHGNVGPNDRLAAAGDREPDLLAAGLARQKLGFEAAITAVMAAPAQEVARAMVPMTWPRTGALTGTLTETLASAPAPRGSTAISAPVTVAVTVNGMADVDVVRRETERAARLAVQDMTERTRAILHDEE